MKKISNLLMMALLAIGMGLTSCDEMLDNAVDPGVMPDVEVTSIALNATSQVLNVDDYFALTATVEPADADYEKIIWSSSDETIATVDENGIIHAVAEGNAIITAQAGNMKATCDILVQDVYAINQYKEASWDGTKVVFEKKLVASVGEITNDFSGDITNGWYSVTGNDVTINKNYTLDGDTYLILCDDAQLTINGQINCAAGSGYNLYIYGQGKGNGKLNIKCNGTAINGHLSNDKVLEIHGGDITVESTHTLDPSLCGNGFNMYSGKFTATTSTAPTAIQFYSSFNVYGGEVVAENTATAADHGGIAGNNVNEVITVYGGKMKVSGGSAPSKAIVGAKFKSGTENIKLYLSADNTSWDDGTVYTTAQAPADSRYIKIE